ncbi:MAG: hypothetical protein JW909_03555 [Planctomycetes bacterium]|nr:hypothetical protein [Planctomycetota bacterium]
MNKKVALVCSSALLLCAGVLAVSTGFWVFGTQDEFLKGECKGLSISSEGTLLPGFAFEAMPVEKEEAVWALFAMGGGRFLAGTGNNGKVMIYEGDKVSEAWDAGVLAVTCFASDGGGLILAGSMPQGKIFSLKHEDGKYKAELFARLPADYVWDLEYSIKDKVFYAATGPEGDLYRIDRDGAVTLWFDSGETHLLSLAVSAEGRVYAGSAPRGLVYEVRDKNSAGVLYDCAEEEVWALHLDITGLIAGANKGEADGTSGQKPPEQGSDAPKQEKKDAGSLPTHAPKAFSVYRVRLDGGAERLFGADKEFVWDVKSDAKGRVLVATGNAGHLYRLATDGTAYETLLDVEQKGITAIGMSDDDVVLLATNAPAALLKIDAKAETGEFVSPVLDAGFTAAWGRMSWRGTGRISVQARSGQTAEPDDTWAEWSASITRPGEKITSPRGRYFQFKVKLEGVAARLDEVRAAFLTDNQRPELKEINYKRLTEKGQPPETPAGKKDSDVRVVQTWPLPRSCNLELNWAAADPDSDKLAYTLYYRFQNAHTWLPLNQDKPLSANKYVWNTEGLPEGEYALKVVASDSEANPPGKALSAVRILDPVVIDNRGPRIENLRVEGSMLTGNAEDDTSFIKHLAVQIDGGEWRFIFSEDGMFDSRSESIRFDLKTITDGGEHIIAVRAVDAEDNAGAASLVVLLQ